MSALSFSSLSPRLRAGAVMVTLALGLVACGGGGGSSTSTSDGSSTSAKSVATGTVTGFGSVYVDGLKYDDANALVSFSIDGAAPRQGTLGELKLGQRVELVTKSDGSVSTVVVAAEVMGSITAISSTGFTVAGQTVVISTDAASPTVWDGATALSDLVVGDQVEVHGSRSDDGSIVATRVERKDASETHVARVMGTVSAWDATAQTFKFSGLTVTVGSTTKVLPSGQTLADGQRVAVFATTVPSGDAMTASTVVVMRGSASTSDTVKVGGLVTAWDATAKTFSVGGFTVDVSAATFTGGTLADLADGAGVRVTGTYADGKVVASEIAVRKKLADGVVAVEGAIYDFVSAANFKVRGVVVDASSSSITYVNGTAADLLAGAKVSIQGTVVSNGIAATQIEFVTKSTTTPSPLRRTEGRVGRIEGAEMLINGQRVRTTSSTVFQGDKQRMRHGARLEVEGSVVNGVLVASRVEIVEIDDAVVARARGPISSFVSVSDFRVAGQKVNASSALFVGGTVSSVVDGAVVEAQGTVVDGVLNATRLTFRQ